MPAFVIVTHEKTRNAGALDEYKKLAPASFAEHPAKFHVVHGRHEVLEGPATEEVILLEFPSYEEAKSCYHSPAYQAASVHRHQGADYRGLFWRRACLRSRPNALGRITGLCARSH